MGLLGSIIGGGLSIVGGLLGKKQKTQKTETSVDYVKMVREARRAGFNPLTALRNGGSAGFSTSTTTGGGMGLSAIVGNAVTGLGNAFANHDPMAEKRAETEQDLLEAQLQEYNDRRNGEGYYKKRSPDLGSAPAVKASRLVNGPGKTAAADPKNPYGFEQKDASQTNSLKGLLPGRGSSKWADTQSVEDEFGDFVSLPYGVGKFVDRLANSARDAYPGVLPKDDVDFGNRLAKNAGELVSIVRGGNFIPALTMPKRNYSRNGVSGTW